MVVGRGRGCGLVGGVAGGRGPAVGHAHSIGTDYSCLQHVRRTLILTPQDAANCRYRVERHVSWGM